jgi:ubiquinol-cytochrome c reductase cytochrome b subunit
LPGAIILLLVGHIYLFRRHGITAKQPYRKPDAAFWPDQVLKDAVACLAVLVVVLFFVIRYGTELTPPADPSESYSAARPEWYFLFLFQFLKAKFLTGWFGHHGELIGAIILPTLLLGILFAMPFIGRWRLGHRFNLGFICALLFGAGLLTWQAKREDANNEAYRASLAEAEKNAERVRHLAQSPSGIPVTGAVTLLRNDPLTQGPKLFSKHCAACHRYDGHDGLGLVTTNAPDAPDL